MIFRRFHVQVIVRIILIALSLAGLLYLALETNLYATGILVTALSAIQIWALIHYVDKTNLSLSRFFDSIRYGDFLQSNSVGQLGGSFTQLSQAMNQVTAAFHAARTEKEEHYRYLQTVIQHVGIGLVAFDDSGDLDLINPAARRILRLSQLRNIGKLSKQSDELAETLRKIEPGQRALVRYTSDYETQQLSIQATQIRLGGRKLTLVSMQNIGSELAEQEMVAWQNLIKVLTHEIMNSVTPIASLANTVNSTMHAQFARHASSKLDDPELSKEISNALNTIERRSQGLMRFVDSYRDLTRIPNPNIRVVSVSEMMSQVDRLLSDDLNRAGVTISKSICPPDLQIACDQDLVEQVLINLYNNAMTALKATPSPALEVGARINQDGRVIIEVADNGPGIPPAILDRIFIPFFTTKKGGSGIGLAISRQIMRLHRGQLDVRSVPNVRTVFTLSF